MKIQVSNGEILDKYSILKIKMGRIEDSEKLNNVREEYENLTPNVDLIFKKTPDSLNQLYEDLLRVNTQLWEIEDEIRECERTSDFSDKFVQLARSVYFTNDERARIKKEINILSSSKLVEEKSYSKY